MLYTCAFNVTGNLKILQIFLELNKAHIERKISTESGSSGRFRFKSEGGRCKSDWLILMMTGWITSREPKFSEF